LLGHVFYLYVRLRLRFHVFYFCKVEINYNLRSFSLKLVVKSTLCTLFHSKSWKSYCRVHILCVSIILSFAISAGWRKSNGVDTTSRLLKIIGLFLKRGLSMKRYPAKETYNFKEPTNRRHPIAPQCKCICVCYGFGEFFFQFFCRFVCMEYFPISAGWKGS